MSARLHCYLVDDDRIFLERMRKFLEAKGHTVATSTASEAALSEIVRQKPDCVLTDMMMPHIDGFELVKRLRREPGLEQMTIIVVSSKSYESDRQRAFDVGANGYIVKPVTSPDIVDQIERIAEDHIELAFWGVHGTLPVPGPATVRYGGNTSCISMAFAKDLFFIFDAGSGIKALSQHLIASNRPMADTRIFLSHPHWDHINALPFFAPLYVPGNEFEILGPAQGDLSVQQLLSAQMDGVYFPIKIKAFGATLTYRDLAEEQITIGDVRVDTMLLNHPGNCLGYRVTYKDRSICYVTDNELYPPETPAFNEHYRDRLVAFVKDADALITDTTYMDDEYPAKMHWGHSSVSQVADLAARAAVKNLYLYHHDPDHTDETIDRKIAAAEAILREKAVDTQCLAPAESQHFMI